MTQLLKKAFDRISELPSEEQERFAAWMLEELDSEARWDELFSRSPALLEKLADEAISEDDAGLTEPLDPDSHEFS